jgi:hypothetical protein
MSAPAVVLLDATQAWVLPARGAPARVPLAASREPDGVPDLTPVREALAAEGAPAELVLIIGGAWLQCARPALPPLAVADRRRVLHHQADRFFTVRGAVASTVYDTVAVACPAAWLDRVREQCAAFTTMRAVLALPEGAAAAGLNGHWTADADPTAGTVLQLELRDGTVRDARVSRGAAPATAHALDVAAVLRGVQAAAARPWPRERQLLDVSSDAALAQRAQRAWWRAAALLVTAAGLLLWAVGRHRDGVLAAAEAAQQAAAAKAAGALEAQARLLRAARESAWLQEANRAAAQPGAPSHVLATLGQLLPATAFVQHLEWDGRQWKIDGSAVNAAELVPRLDAVPTFAQVRSLAPSTRFLDGGTPRSSFSIGFAVRDSATAGGAGGQR